MIVPHKHYLLAIRNLKLKFGLAQDLMGSKLQRYSPYGFETFSTKTVFKSSHDSLHKFYLLAFWNAQFKLEKLEIYIVANE